LELLLIAVAIACLFAGVVIGAAWLNVPSRGDRRVLLFFLFYLIALIWVCISLVLALARRRLRRQPELAWQRMSPGRKAARLLLTVVGVAVFVGPLAWIGWRLING
jgi:hypothetical protein